MCWTKWPPPLSHRRGMGIMKLKISLFKNDPLFFLVIIFSTWMHGLAMKSCHCGAQQPEKGVRNGRKCLSHCEWKWYSFIWILACPQRCSAHHCSIFRCRDVSIMTCIYRHAHVFHTLRLVPSLTQVRSRHHFLWCWLKMRKISPTGAENHCKPNHFCLKVTARSKKCATCRK